MQPGRYQHTEITCHTDFTSPRLVLYTYKSARWPFIVRRIKRSPFQPVNRIGQTPRDQRVLRIEAQMHGLDDLFHVARSSTSAENDRWVKRARFHLGRWFGLTSMDKKSDLHCTDQQNSFGCDDISLTDASHLATDCPQKAPPTHEMVHGFDCEPLMLFLESGETCLLRFDASPDRDQCLRALHGILNKNKLLRGYPDMDYVWTATVRYKIRATHFPLTSLPASGFANSVGRRFLCLTVSEFLIVHCNLRQPELVCPYSFVRQCASRRDGQFRLWLGRASPLGECEVVLQMSSAMVARFTHETFTRLMTQCGTRYRQLRSSFVSDLSTEFIEHLPRLPRPSTVIHTAASSNPTETRPSRVSFGIESNQSDGSKPAPALSNSVERSWDTLSRGTSPPGTEWASSFGHSGRSMRRTRSFDAAELFPSRKTKHKICSHRKTHSAGGRVNLPSIAAPGSSLSPNQSVSVVTVRFTLLSGSMGNKY
ncbi:unnamed protein product [Echinostoma caproni]|uniref:IRS-type PTB domain-containing protein n=1 Tax=Echinostoma caproni TaxID=27848 RepID=A0A183AKB5_9TREM|nr:unnamed protein product [Echinostoma caproni]